MFFKRATYTAEYTTQHGFQVLAGAEVIDNSNLVSTIKQVKTASDKSAEFARDGEEKEFDLAAEIKEFPDSLFIKCFAIKADEMNDNGDYFSREELKKAYQTFVGKPVFTNHQNTDINQARGKVIHSWWDEEKNGISIIARIDAEAFPQLARGISQKYVTSTSMGANVTASICSLCHNYAEQPSDFCGCIKERKTRTVSAKKQKCQYHKHGKDEKCPLCGSTKKEAKTYDYEGKIFEYNYGIRFIENSVVCSPACHDCGITEIIDTKDILSKVSYVQSKLPSLLKAASTTKIMCTDKGCVSLLSEQQVNDVNKALGFFSTYKNQIEKFAGQKELGDLNQSLTLVTGVLQSMLKQRQQLDMEFVSQGAEVLKDLQELTDELTQQGYGRIPSPEENAEGTPPPPTSPEGTPPPAMGGGVAPTNMQPVNPTPGGGSNVMTGTAGPGTVTAPTAKGRLDFSKTAKIIDNGHLLQPKMNIKGGKRLDPKFKVGGK